MGHIQTSAKLVIGLSATESVLIKTILVKSLTSMFGAPAYQNKYRQSGWLTKG